MAQRAYFGSVVAAVLSSPVSAPERAAITLAAIATLMLRVTSASDASPAVLPGVTALVSAVALALVGALLSRARSVLTLPVAYLEGGAASYGIPDAGGRRSGPGGGPTWATERTAAAQPQRPADAIDPHPRNPNPDPVRNLDRRKGGFRIRWKR